MRLGLNAANTAAVTADEVDALVRFAEEHGFDSLWTVEHVVVPKGYASTYPYSRTGRMAKGREDFEIPDPFVWLSYAAAVSTTLRLATGVTILPQRNPLILAKEVATLDVLSGGRMILGVGAGWLEEEFAALGVPFEGRGDRVDEYIGALRALWTQDVAAFEGDHVSFSDVYSRPRPLQRPVPIVVGGHSRRAARRAGTLADGYYPASTKIEELPGLVALARETAERNGRDPAALEITMPSRVDADVVEMIFAAGVDRVLISAEAGEERLAPIAERLL